MSERNAGSASITLSTNDKTQAGFLTAKKNLQDFQRTVKQTRGTMLPFSEMMKGGMFAGGAMAGMGTLMDGGGQLDNLLGSLTGKVSKSKSELDGMGKSMSGLGNETLTAGNMMQGFGTKLAATAATGYALVQAISAIPPVLTAIKSGLLMLAVANPILAIATAATAAAAGIVWLTSTIMSSTKETERNTKAIQQNLESLQKRRKLSDENREVDMLQIERLRQLETVENKSARDMAEAGEIIDSLNKRYGGLGLTINSVTGSIGGLNEALEDKMLDRQVADRTTQLKKELAEIDELIQSLKKPIPGNPNAEKERVEKKGKAEDQKKSIESQLAYYEQGFREDVLDKKRAEVFRARMSDFEKEKNKREEMLKFIAGMEQDIQKNRQNALQNELVALQQRTKEQKKSLEDAIKEKEVRGESAAEEKKNLAVIEKYQDKLQKQIEARYRKEARRSYGDFLQRDDSREFAEFLGKRDRIFKERLDANPMAMIPGVNRQLAGAENMMKEAREEVQRLHRMSINQVRYVSKDHQQKIADAENAYNQIVEFRNRAISQRNDVRDSIRSRVAAARDRLQEERSSPVLDNFESGSAAAQRKFLELQQQNQSPIVVTAKDILKEMKEENQRRATNAKELNELTDQVAGELISV